MKSYILKQTPFFFLGKKKQGETLLMVRLPNGGFPMNQFVCSLRNPTRCVAGGGIIHIWNSSESPPFTGSLGQIIDSTSLPSKEGI